MLAFIELNLNLYTLCALLIAAVITGYVMKNIQLGKLKRTIESLENEMLQSHAEILRLQKENSERYKLQESQTPIVFIHDSNTDSGKPDQLNGKGSKKLFPPVRKTNP